MMAAETWRWYILNDGSWGAMRDNVVLLLQEVWDQMGNRYSFEYEYVHPGGHNLGGGITWATDLENAKREAERMASWSMAR